MSGKTKEKVSKKKTVDKSPVKELNTKLVDLLEEDKPIANQKFVCISFVSPEKIIKKNFFIVLILPGDSTINNFFIVPSYC
jgi:hypothetical protein